MDLKSRRLRTVKVGVQFSAGFGEFGATLVVGGNSAMASSFSTFSVLALCPCGALNSPLSFYVCFWLRLSELCSICAFDCLSIGN